MFDCISDLRKLPITILSLCLHSNNSTIEINKKEVRGAERRLLTFRIHSEFVNKASCQCLPLTGVVTFDRY